MKKLTTFLKIIILLFIFIIFWQIIIHYFNIPKYILPSPIDIFNVLKSQPYLLFKNTLITILEALGGLLIAIFLGITVATILVNNSKIYKFGISLATGIQAVPIIVFAPIFALWFGNDYITKIFLAALLSWFPLLINATNSMKNIDSQLETIFEIYKPNKWVKFKLLRLPFAIKGIVSGIKISSGLAIIGAIVAEYSGATGGIGYLIQQSSYRSDNDIMYTAVLISAITSFLLSEIIFNFLSITLRKYLRK